MTDNTPAQTTSVLPAAHLLLPTDIPDPDVIRVGDVYYMVSTTMYFNPGIPVMKSRDLLRWEIVGYVYDILDDGDRDALRNGVHAYGKGSWAACLRFHKGTFYVVAAANHTGKTYIFQTEDIENGPWRRFVLDGIYHDSSLLFDDDGRVYLVYGGGAIRLVELTARADGLLPGTSEQIIIENANVGGDGGLPAEGSHIYKINGLYYLFLIAWPPSHAGSGTGQRIELCYRSDKILGPYEGRVVLDNSFGVKGRGVAQGGLADTAEGLWYAMLFQDRGGVGRTPVLVSVTWEDAWPVFGEAVFPKTSTIAGETSGSLGGASPDTSAFHLLTPGIVTSDEFDGGAAFKGYAACNTDAYRSTASEPGENEPNGQGLAFPWQWNHNPDHRLWSLSERPGYLRLKTGRVCSDLLQARNSLTQRTFHPHCSGAIALDISGLQNGDRAGLAALQECYGSVGVAVENGESYLVMVSTNSGQPLDIQRIPLGQHRVYLGIDFHFGAADLARFCYSLDEQNWHPIGETLTLHYRLSHFTGYRFALFCYATRQSGGYGDFDYFRLRAAPLLDTAD